jgi:hypothetical protein
METQQGEVQMAQEVQWPGLWAGWSGVRILAEAKTFVFSANRPNLSWGPPNLPPICTGVLLGGKATTNLYRFLRG